MINAGRRGAAEPGLAGEALPLRPPPCGMNERRESLSQKGAPHAGAEAAAGGKSGEHACAVLNNGGASGGGRWAHPSGKQRL